MALSGEVLGPHYEGWLGMYGMVGICSVRCGCEGERFSKIERHLCA